MGTRAIDITGKRFGKLTAIRLDHIEKTPTGTVHYWLYRCDCGNEKVIRKGEVSQGGSQSCGCYLRESVKERSTKHGKFDTRLYRIMHDMKQRCLNPNNKHYKHYGGRGIKIYDLWLEDFDAFYDWAINNGYNDNLTIERIDVNGNYEPNNCKWIVINDQLKNTRRSRLITCNGETLCLKDWADKLNIPMSTLRYQLNKDSNYIVTNIKEKINNGIC